MTLEEILKKMQEEKQRNTSVVNNSYNLNNNENYNRKDNLISNTDSLKFNISNYKAPNALEYFGNDVKNILDNARQGANRGIISAGKYGYGVADLATDYIEKGMEKTLGVSDNISKLLGKNTNFQERSRIINKKNQETREKIKKSFNNELEGYDKDIQSNIENTQSSALKKVSELAPSMGNSTFGATLSAIPIVGKPLSTAYFISSAGGSYMKEAEERGATDEQALAYGTALGLAEGATEKLELGWLTKGAKNLGKGMIKEALRNYGINIAENYIQEALMEPIQETANQIIFGESEWNNMLERMNNAGIDGALSALIMDGASSGLGSSINIVNKIQNNQTVTQTDIDIARKDLRTVTEKISDLETNSNKNNQSVANTQMVEQKNNNINSADNMNLKSELIKQVNSIGSIDEDTRNLFLNTINKTNSNEVLENIRDDLQNFDSVNEEIKQSDTSNSATIPINRNEVIKQNYKKYANAKIDNTIIKNAQDLVPSNAQGKRTKEQWLKLAEQIGSNVTEQQAEMYAYKTWMDMKPNNKENLNRQGKNYVKFTLEEWIDKIKEANGKNEKIIENKTAIPISEEMQLKNDIDNFSKQVDNIKNGKFPKRDMLTLLSNTPKVLQDIGLNNHPITMTQRHLDTIMNADGKYKNANYHNLGKDIVKQLPKAIANPLDVVQSNTDKNSIVLTTYLADKQDRTIVASIKIDGKGFVNDIVIDTNVMTSAYGRNNYDKFMENNIKKGNLLYDVDQGVIKKLTGQGYNYLGQSTSKEVSPVQQLTGYTSSINNIIPRGENYVNNAENNQKSTENAPFNPEFKEKQRKRYKTIIESDLVSKEAKMVAKELMGVDTYVPESNVNQLRKADYTIEQLGTERALDTLKNKVDGGQKITGDDIALGDRLIQYYSKTGEKARLQDAIQYTAMAGTEAGRTVQAMSIIAHQSPEGQTLWIQRSVDKLNQKIASKKGAKIEVIEGKKVAIKNGKNLDLQLFEFTADMQEKLMSVKSNEEMYSVLDEIYEELGQQVPKSTMEKIDSWRYFSMLANPTTHVRNIAGNTAMTGIQGVKNVVAGGIEDVVSLFNKDMERSKSVVRLTNLNKKTVKFAMEDIKNVADRLGLNQNKYSPTSRIESNKREFKSKILNNTLGKVYAFNSKFLEVEDGWGLKFNYAKELTEYMVANKYDVNNITDEQLGKARNYAIEKAKEATFHQESKLASAINQIGNNNEITKFILDSTLPFKAVPINVAKTGLEYSPLQIAKSATVDIANLRNGKITVNQYIDNVAKGLTGTGIAIVGYALAQAGILKASGSDDDKEKYDEKQGKQAYSIQIGGNTYSLSWLAPTAIPLFIGVEIAENMNNDKNEKESISSDDDTKYNKAIKSATNILDAFTNCMNPMTEMSMLSGLTSTLKSYDQGSTQFLTSLGTNITKSYVNQFVPTVLGKVARLTDDYERDTTSTKKGVLPKAIDSTKNQFMNKIPGLRQMLPTKKDVWGNEVKQTDNIALKVFENTLAPYTRKEISSDKVDKELNTLYDKTKETSIIPKNISKDFIIDGQRYRLTNKEYNEYQTQYGKTTHKTITDVIESSTYKSLSDSEKVNIIKEIYSDTKEILKKKFADEHKLEYKRSDTDIKIDELVDNGLNVANAYVYKTIVNKIQGDKDKDGKSISCSEATKKVEYIYNMKDNDTQKDKMLSLISDTDTKPTMSDLKKLNGNYLTYIQQSGKKDNNDVSQRDKYMMYVDTGIPVKTLNKYYDEIGKIEGIKDSNGKTISGSKKKAVIHYVNSLPLNIPQKQILITRCNSSYGKDYKNEIRTYINSLSLSKARKEQIWKELYEGGNIC